MKKALIIVASVLGILIIGGIIFFKITIKKMNEEIDREFANMPQIDVASIPDGTYSAKWGSFVVKADLDVVVSGGKIEKINMKKMLQICRKDTICQMEHFFLLHFFQIHQGCINLMLHIYLFQQTKSDLYAIFVNQADKHRVWQQLIEHFSGF